MKIIYIYLCVCVCVCRNFSSAVNYQSIEKRNGVKTFSYSDKIFSEDDELMKFNRNR